MNVNITLSDVEITALTDIVESYNSERRNRSTPISGSNEQQYEDISCEEYLEDRVRDLLKKYVNQYNAKSLSDASNLELYERVVKNKNNPAVASALQELISVVDSVEE